MKSAVLVLALAAVRRASAGSRSGFGKRKTVARSCHLENSPSALEPSARLSGYDAVHARVDHLSQAPLVNRVNGVRRRSVLRAYVTFA